MPDDCPSVIIVLGYLMNLIVDFAGIWYLFIWLSVCEPCTGKPFVNILILDFIVIFLFAIYMVVKMVFPARTGPLLNPH